MDIQLFSLTFFAYYLVGNLAYLDAAILIHEFFMKIFELDQLICWKQLIQYGLLAYENAYFSIMNAIKYI